MRPKIVILINALGGGGSERVVSLLTNSLCDEFEIHLLLFSKTSEYQLPEDQIIFHLDEESRRPNVFNLLRMPLLARRLKNYCLENDIELVLSFLTRPNLVACMAKKNGLDISLLISERTNTGVSYDYRKPSGKLMRWMISRLYPFANEILPNSTASEEALRDELGVRSSYQVVKNPIDLTLIRQLAMEQVNDVDFNQFTFLCVAGFRREKNHRLLIDGFMMSENKASQLVLIGKGPTLNTTQQYVQSLGLDSRVRFLGHRANPFKYVSRANCLVLSSNFEGFPNVILEALAVGCPVISTNCGSGPRELLAKHGSTPLADGVELGKHGILVRVGDPPALASAMDDIAKGRVFNKADARQRVAEFDLPKVSREFATILRSALTRQQH